MQQRQSISGQALLVASPYRSQHTTAAPASLDANRRRRLVDYTQFRSDGTKSSVAINMDNISDLPSKTNTLRGMPACHALEASLVEMFADVEEITAVSNTKDERIDFYLKVKPKSQRKTTRVSTLDRVDGRDLQRTKSSRSLGDKSKISMLKRITRRSLSTPCA